MDSLDYASDTTMSNDNATTTDYESTNESKRKRRKRCTSGSDTDYDRNGSKLKSLVVKVEDQLRPREKSPEKQLSLAEVDDQLKPKEKSPDQLSLEEFKSLMRQSVLENHPLPKRDRRFDELKISSRILKGLDRMYIDRMTDFQYVLLSALLKNSDDDLFIRCKPQSLKKTCYLIDSIQNIESGSTKLESVILVPTAEIAIYLAETAKQIAKYRGIVIDYVTKDCTLRKENANLLIATPGSLLQCMERFSSYWRRYIRCFVIDEFELHLSSQNNIRKLRKIIQFLRVTDCKIKVFSTCFGQQALFFAKQFINRHIIELNLLNQDCFREIHQFYTPCYDRDDKYRALVKILRYSICNKVVIYIARISPAVNLCRDLIKEGFRNVMLLTSTSCVEERLQVNNSFNTVKQGILILNYPLLLGISLEDLSMVINYNLPDGDKRYIYHEYFHKICKSTGSREGRAGFVVNLVDEEEIESINKLELFFELKINKLNVGSLDWKVIERIHANDIV